jgi:hypothetical protein
VGSSFDVAAPAVGAVAVLAGGPVVSELVDEDCAFAADGPKTAAPIPPPARSEAAIAAAAMGFFMW